MTRQYYCWKVALTFACGCVETTPTTHLCGPDREGCNNWLTYKKTNKACEDHRRGAGGEGGGRWGLEEEGNSSSPYSSSPSSARAMTTAAQEGQGYVEGYVDLSSSGSAVGGGGGEECRRGVGEGNRVQGEGWEGCYARQRM